MEEVTPSRITKQEFHEWLTLPCTKELMQRMQFEEEAWRTYLGSGGGVRDRSVLEAGSAALVVNAKADALAHFRNHMTNYDEVVSEDRKEVKSEQEVVEGDSAGEDVPTTNRWASDSRQALRHKARQ